MTKSETRFHKWLNLLNVAHIFIDPSRETFASPFHGKCKRPDFIIFPNGKRPYAIDIKEKRLEYRTRFKGLTFELSSEDVFKLFKFQDNYRLTVWLGLTPDSDSDVWYFINMYEVINLPAQYQSKSNGFWHIPYTKFQTERAFLLTEHSDKNSIADQTFFLNDLTKHSPSFEDESKTLKSTSQNVPVDVKTRFTATTKFSLDPFIKNDSSGLLNENQIDSYESAMEIQHREKEWDDEMEITDEDHICFKEEYEYRHALIKQALDEYERSLESGWPDDDCDE